MEYNITMKKHKVTTTTRITHADIELASLNRLENIIASLMHMLREEKQRSIATLIVTLLLKEKSSNARYCDQEEREHNIRHLMACGNNRFLISNIQVHSTHDEFESLSHMAKEATVKRATETKQPNSAAWKSNDANTIANDIKTLEADMLSQIRSMEHNHTWLHEYTRKYSWYKQRQQRQKRQQGSSHRSSSSSSSSSETASSSFDSAINRLRILPLFYDDVNINNANAPSELKLGMFLFFQWICLLSSTHEECPIELVHFEWLPRDGIVRVHMSEPPINTSPELLQVSSSPSCVISSHSSVADDNDYAVLSSSSAIVAGDDDNGVWDTLKFTSSSPLQNFTFFDGHEIVHETSRAKNQDVRVVDRQWCDNARPRPSEGGGGKGGCLTVLSDSSSNKSKKQRERIVDTVVDDGVKNNYDGAETSLSAFPEITREQKRILDTLDYLWQRRTRCDTTTTASVDDYTTRNKEEKCTAGRRVVIDGVAGSGKTFLLGLMLRRFPRVLYLVKKRNFIDATSKRFHEFGSKLRTQTIDSYLMNLLNIKVLQTWLSMRQGSLHVLKQRLRSLMAQKRKDAASRRSFRHFYNNTSFSFADEKVIYRSGGEKKDYRSSNRNYYDLDNGWEDTNEEELVFVDEFSLIESSLADLLNIALHDRIVILVGDCNQQPAIGEREDQAVRTMLGYENICFMYENVRARDPSLLRRLTCFTARSSGGGESGGGNGSEDLSCLAALCGLPRRSTVDMRMFLRSMRCIGYNSVLADYNLLPRLIVTSNERVNYANWAVGYLLWRNCPICHGDPGEETREENTTATFSPPPPPSHPPPKKKKKTTVTLSDYRQRPVCCLRYKRMIVVAAKRRRPRITVGSGGYTIIGDGRKQYSRPQQPMRENSQEEIHTHDGDSDSLTKTIRRQLSEDDAYADEHFVLVGMRYRMIYSRAGWPMQIGSRVIVRAITSRDTVIVETDDEKRVRCQLRMTYVKPYEYGSRWQTRLDDVEEYSLYMFPFVMDAATTVYQVQGLTFDQDTYQQCYVDVYGMNDKALYVTLSRFQSEGQIRGVINCNSLCR